MRALLLLVVAALAAGCGGADVSRQIGARCDDSSECDDRCLLAADDWPGGFCTLSCDSDADCPDATLCSDDEGGVCLFQCASTPGCAFLGQTWVCQTRPGHPGGQVMVCVGG